MNTIKRNLYPKLHPLDGAIGKLIPPRNKPRALIRERGDEYVYSVNCTESELIYALQRYGYSYGILSNFSSTLKYVETDDGKSWEQGSAVYRSPWDGKWMHHAYWMKAAESDYTYHIGHHKERNYLDIPDGLSEHTDYKYHTIGDPDGHLRRSLDNSMIDYTTLENEEYEI